MEGIVDRIENGKVILEINKDFICLDIKNFPDDIQEGDMVKKYNDEFIILDKDTKDRKRKMDDLLDSLFDK